MALFKTPTKPAPNAAYTIPADLQEASAALVTALDARSRVDTAVARNSAERQASNGLRTAAEAEVDRLELALALALAIEGAETTSMEHAADSARTAAQDATTALDRATRLQGALYARAPLADAEITTAQATFQAALGGFGRITTLAFAAEVHAATQPLIAVLLRGHALAAAIGSLSPQAGVLADILVPSPAPSEPPIITGAHIDGADLAVAWRSDPSASALAEIMAPLTDLRRRIAGHLAFVQPPAPAKPYVVQNQNVAEYNQGAEARDAARDAAAPKPAPWVGYSHAFENSGHYSRNR